MAKNTIGKTASDKAFDSMMAQISKINSAERRGESLQAHQDLYKKKTQPPVANSKKDSAFTNAIATRRMRTKKKKTAPVISQFEQALIDRAIELNVPVEFLRKHPNLQPAKKEVDLDSINMALMNQLVLNEI